MKIGILCETFPGERRVAQTPGTIPTLLKLGATVTLESGAGQKAGYPDHLYTEKGAQLSADRNRIIAESDILLQVRTLGANPEAGSIDIDTMPAGQLILGMSDPLGNTDAMQILTEKKISLFAMEMIPRITRAQSMDVLSSMATIAGYKAVMLAANYLPKMFPMMMTAAGTIKPAKVFVLGAGVAGLQAIASAKRLGAIVQAYDVRPVVKEQIESLGGKFVELQLETGDSEDKGGYAKQLTEQQQVKQREQLAEYVAESDVVITTAAIPGRRSPLLVTAEAVQKMQPGSVIIDLAAERGGNCALSQPDKTVIEHGVTILGPTNLSSEIPTHASQMYAKNLTTLLQLICNDGEIRIDLEDEIIAGTLVTHNGKICNERINSLITESNRSPQS